MNKPAVITAEQQERFIDLLIEHGRPVAEQHHLPTAAMVACGIVESGYGTSAISRVTGCPFNLQRPDWYAKWVHCPVKWLTTGTKTDARGKTIQTMKAPFCVAEGATEAERLADAARIWCEWVTGWPQKSVNQYMQSLRERPERFTRELPRLGFGEAAKRIQNGESFVKAFRRHALLKRSVA